MEREDLDYSVRELMERNPMYCRKCNSIVTDKPVKDNVCGHCKKNKKESDHDNQQW